MPRGARVACAYDLTGTTGAWEGYILRTGDDHEHNYSRLPSFRLHRPRLQLRLHHPTITTAMSYSDNSYVQTALHNLADEARGALLLGVNGLTSFAWLWPIRGIYFAITRTSHNV